MSTTTDEPQSNSPLLPRWLVIVVLGVPLALLLFAASPIGFNIIYVEAGIPALLLLWKLAALCAAVLAVRAALQRKWRQAIAVSVLMLAVALIVALAPHRFIALSQYIGNVGRFVMMRSSYDERIAVMPADGKPRLVEFEWDGMPWVTFAVVYDESDQIALPPERQTAAWREQAKHRLNCEGYGVVQPFWAHYYLVSFPC